MISDLQETKCGFCGAYGLREREAIHETVGDVYWFCRCEACGYLNKLHIVGVSDAEDSPKSRVNAPNLKDWGLSNSMTYLKGKGGDMDGNIMILKEIVRLAMIDYIKGVLVVRKLYPVRGRKEQMAVVESFKSAVYFLWGDGGLLDWAETTGLDKLINIKSIRERTQIKAETTCMWIKNKKRGLRRRKLLEKYLQEEI